MAQAKSDEKKIESDDNNQFKVVIHNIDIYVKMLRIMQTYQDLHI